MHYQKELSSYKERALADGRKIREQDQKMEDMGRWFEADKVLLESNFHNTLLDSTDATFEMGCQAMASLYSEAAHEFDGGKGLFLPDWEVLLHWVNVLEQRKPTNTPDKRKSFVKKLFVLVPVSMLGLTLYPPVMCPRIPRREKLVRSMPMMTLLRRRNS